MKMKMVLASIVGAAAITGALFAAPATARAEALPHGLAAGLDRQPAEYSMTAAKQRRLMIMQETMRQQQRGRGGYGPAYGRGPRPGYYSRGYGYGPRPGYGYGPRPGYGYGPRPGFDGQRPVYGHPATGYPPGVYGR